jgi:hypothetical protein
LNTQLQRGFECPCYKLLFSIADGKLQVEDKGPIHENIDVVKKRTSNSNDASKSSSSNQEPSQVSLNRTGTDVNSSGMGTYSSTVSRPTATTNSSNANSFGRMSITDISGMKSHIKSPYPPPTTRSKSEGDFPEMPNMGTSLSLSETEDETDLEFSEGFRRVHNQNPSSVHEMGNMETSDSGFENSFFPKNYNRTGKRLRKKGRNEGTIGKSSGGGGLSISDALKNKNKNNIRLKTSSGQFDANSERQIAVGGAGQVGYGQFEERRNSEFETSPDLRSIAALQSKHHGN